MVAGHVCEHCSVQHITLVHVIDHLAVLLIDLVDHVADGALLVNTRESHLLNLEHLCHMLRLETVRHFEYAHVVRYLRLIVIPRLSIRGSAFLGFIDTRTAGHRVPGLDTTHVVTAILLLFDLILQLLAVEGIVDHW